MRQHHSPKSPFMVTSTVQVIYTPEVLLTKVYKATYTPQSIAWGVATLLPESKSEDANPETHFSLLEGIARLGALVAG
jgi:hypothetical protein